MLVGKLQVGDKLQLQSGQEVEVDVVEVEHLEEAVKVYNFEVADWHTYYVSEKNVLVHNKAARYQPININKVKDEYLKKQGFDAHEIKSDVVGNKNIAYYDIYVDKDTGSCTFIKRVEKGRESLPGYTSNDWGNIDGTNKRYG